MIIDLSFIVFPFSLVMVLGLLANSCLALMDSEQNYEVHSADSAGKKLPEDGSNSREVSAAGNSRELTRETCSRILNLPYGAAETYAPQMW